MKAPARYIQFSNLLSYLSLLCGLAAILAARELLSWEAAGLLIAISALADTFDGKFARRFVRTAGEIEFGANLDSLVDAVSFGIVPIVCLDSLLPFESTQPRILWAACAGLYLVCALTRLGYYNVHHHEHSGFVGLPTTLAALLWSTVFLLHPSVQFTALMFVVVGAAMVSVLPVPRPRGITMWMYMMWFLVVFGIGAGRVVFQLF